MKLKKILASASIFVFSLVSFAAMTFQTTAQTEIAYSGPGTGAVGTGSNNNDYRVNIYNVWGNSVKDINNVVNVEKNVVVTFTVSGLGTHTANLDSSGNQISTYEAVLMGTMGINQYWDKSDDTVENEPVPITGDGQYTAVFNLKDTTSTIDCLVLQTNIDINGLDVLNPPSAEECGLTIKIDSIVADSDTAVSGSTGVTTTTVTDNSGLTTTTSISSYSIAATTTTGNLSSGTLGNSTLINSAATGDNGIASIAIAGLVVTAAAGVVTQIKKKK